METFGTLEEYDGKEPWPSYTDRFDANFNANSFDDDEKRKQIFLLAVGTNTYAALGSLLVPAKPKERKFKELMATLNSHFVSAPPETTESFRFPSIDQLNIESVVEFIVELWQIAEHCNFGQALSHMLMEHLVCGIQDKSVQQWLLLGKKKSDLGQGP